MNESAIYIDNVWKYFGDFAAIRGVSLSVPRGSILALIGRNGAGKTTLLKMIAGLLRPSEGTIQLDSKGDGDENSSEMSSMGVVGHGEWIYDDLTARENLDFFANLYAVKNTTRTVDHWLNVVGLGQFSDSRTSEFSRGMRQRLAIARALLHDPRILLLDEPWTALDDRAVQLLSSLLRDAHSRNRTVVICSHQLREVLDIATNIVAIDTGKVIFEGLNSPTIKENPDEFYNIIS
jgi:heme exporter protein A